MSDWLVEKLIHRDFEGFVFSMPGHLLKWKAFDEEEQNSQKDALQILQNRCPFRPKSF
jgi:hypothetical protein